MDLYIVLTYLLCSRFRSRYIVHSIDISRQDTQALQYIPEIQNTWNSSFFLK
jgi:hypothetical protein